MKTLSKLILAVALSVASLSAQPSGGIQSPVKGGTGVANAGASTITLGGPVVLSGAFPFTITLTGSTSLTAPTSGTLATVSGNLGTPSALVGTNISGTAASLTAGNSSQLLGATWAAPGTIGDGTPRPANFTTLSATGEVLASSASAVGFHAKTTVNSVSPYVRWESNNRNWYGGAYDTGADAAFNLSLNANLSSPFFSLAPSGVVTLPHYGAGTATFDSSGNITSISDERAKDTVGDFTKGLPELRRLTPHLFHYKKETGLNTSDLNVSVYAQDLLAAGINEAVFQTRTVPDTEEVTDTFKDKDGKSATRTVQRQKKDAKGELLTKTVTADYMTVSDRPILAAAVNAIKTLADQNDALAARLAKLEAGKN